MFAQSRQVLIIFDGISITESVSIEHHRVFEDVNVSLSYSFSVLIKLRKFYGLSVLELA